MTDKNIFELLDITPDVKEKPLTITETKTNHAPIIEDEKDMMSVEFDKDFEEARNNLLYVLGTTKNALEEIHLIAKDKEGAKEYDSLNSLLKTVGDASSLLMNLHERRKKFKDVKVKEMPTKTQNNAIFVGSSTDLKKFLKGE